MKANQPTELILITKRFPFYKTEAFLESEIKLVAQSYDKVTIYPYEMGSYCRKVPENVEVDCSFSAVYQRKISRAAKAMFSSDFIKAVWAHRSKLKGLKDLGMLLKFISNGRAYARFFGDHTKLSQDTNVVYTYWFNEATYAFLRLREEGKIRSSVISRAHRFDIYEAGPNVRSFWPYRKYCLEKLQALYSISEDGKHFLETNYGINPAIEVAKLGVYDKQQVAKKSKEGTSVIVSVSRVAPMKRVDFIRMAVIRFAQKYPGQKVKWVHFGDGDGWKDLREKSDVPENLTVILKGYVKNEAIYDYYASHPVDLFTNLSSTEGIPVSIMEAISFGIPIVATKVGGTGEIVGTETGKLLPPNPSLEEVVAAFGEVLEKSFSADQVREFYNENFNAEKNYTAFAKSLSELTVSAGHCQLT
ncbi:glycosyltransferase [Echinicola rosea]|uniref:Glycosyl transferase n=1 Tax=Echinicola rosea TaxID=1807691 RepID=A0ABQ1USQ3_9BACT|nr:glycosyltransferase [Echinicola rosea]GGF25834.1 glycosyl transferase [Echinicola rosea]